ncbi:peptidase inhibitor family I36 protein [Streptomyces sp. NPDC052236]|uniref:peptidase inhibitor family I36 protein n=1 Tax=Streptomyces sp. NPDC052236 TaxID=3365686 RepID=UPI0037D1A8F1
MRIRRALAALGALVGSAALSLGITSPVSAAAPNEAATSRAAASCPDGHVCFWSLPDFRGKMTIYDNPVWHDCAATDLQPARSIYNNDDQTWSFYGDLNCTAHAVTLASGETAEHTRVFSWQ